MRSPFPAPSSLFLLVLFLTTLALGTLFWASLRWPSQGRAEDWLFWGGLLFLLARLRVPLPLLGEVSLHFLGALASIFALTSPWVALLSAISLPPASRPPFPLREAFNRSQVALSTLVALALFRHFPTPEAGALIAGAGYFAANLGAMLLLAWVQKGLPPKEAWRRNFAPYGLTYLAVSPIALLLARLYERPVLAPWGGIDALLLLLPVVYLKHMWSLRSRVEEASKRMLEGMVRSLEARDRYTAHHSERVTAIALDIAREMGLPEAQRDLLRLGGKLHDIGKVGIPDAVLLKPGKLTDEEWALMRSHPEVGLRVLAPMLPFLGPIEEIVLYHHERWDGKGYPKGLEGEAIPLLARILAVADAYEAMTADRPYRKGLPPERALAILEEEAGKQFDPAVVRAFRRAYEKNPIWKERAVPSYEVQP